MIDNGGEHILLAFDVGEGKTLTALYHYLKWRRVDGLPLIVFAPKAKVKEGGWVREAKRVEEAEGVAIPISVRTIDSITKLTLEEVYRSAFILDECHLYKGRSRRGKAFVALMNTTINSVACLSATPATNGWEDCKNYFAGFGRYDLLNVSKRAKNLDYKEEYVAFRMESMYVKGGQNRQFRVVDHHKQEDVLRDAFNEFAYTLEGFDKSGLPDRTFQAVEFPMTNLYKAVKKDRVLVNPDGSVEEIDSPSKLCHTLRRLSNTDAKIEYLETIFDSTSANILVFYVYTEHCNRIEELAKKAGKDVYIINGSATQIPDKDVENAVVIAQYQAGGPGLELQMCTVSVMFSPTYSYQDYRQALGRNYGGFRQDKHVHVYEFKAQGIDADIYDVALQYKRNFSEELYMEKLGSK